MPTKLSYALTTDPFPLQASPATGTPHMAKLTVVASNPDSSQPVTLKRITITIPVGPDASQLTSAAPASPVPPMGWSLSDTKPGEGTVEYVFAPQEGHGEVAGEGLTFTFNAIQLNTQPGTAKVTVKEISTSTSTVPPFTVTKFPAAWGQVSFWAAPDIVQAGDSTTLHWSGPAGATYTIDYHTPQRGIVYVPAEGDPPLSNQGQYPRQGQSPLALERNTIFYLIVTAVVDGRTYIARQNVPVTVASVKITARGPDEPVNALEQVVIKWTTVSAKTVTLEPGRQTVDATSGSGEFTVQPTSNTTYTLIAKDARGKEKRAFVAVYVNPPQIISLTATPAAVKPGWPVTLSWETVSSAFTSLAPGIGKVKGSGSTKVTPPAGTTTYMLTAQSQPPFAIETVNVIATKPGFHLVASDIAYGDVEAAFVIDKKLFLIDIGRNRAWFSTDGLTLTPVQIEKPYVEGCCGVVFDAGSGPRMWLLGVLSDTRPSNGVWRATDESGTSWEQVKPANNKIWSPRTGFGCVVFKKKIWVFGGRDSDFKLLNDVWSSPDGVNWTLETNNPGWTPRFWFGATTFTLAPSTNQIWLCGGVAGTSYTNDVYYTDDGVHWSQWTTTKVPWAPRGRPLLQQMGDSLWLMSGNVSNSTPFRDVWSLVGPQHSRWSQYIEAAPWQGEFAPGTSVVFNGLMWCMGSNSQFHALNPDIWYFLPDR